jgi:integrase/recombinase XerD
MTNKRVYNKIYDKAEYEKVNIENKEIIDDFIEEYQQRKMKESTLKQYKNNLRILAIFVLKFCDNRSFFDLNKRDFRKLSIWLSDTLQLSNARTNSVLSACRSMLSYCEESDEWEYDNNISKKVKGLPKEPVRNDDDACFMSFDQIMAVREKLIEMGAYQLAALHMVLFDSGARRNEIAQIKKKGILDGNKTNMVVGKRGKQFAIVFLDDTKELIAKYLEQRGEDDIDALWTVGSGAILRAASYDNIYEFVLKIRKVLCDIEGREVNIYPHSYRHSRCECLLQGQDTRLLDKDGNPKQFTLEQVQVFLHHSDPSTTLNYAKDHSEDVINKMFDI